MPALPDDSYLLNHARPLLNFGKFAMMFTYGSVLIHTKHVTLNRSDNEHLFYKQDVKHWLDKTINQLNIKLHMHGEIATDGSLLVSNHISWLDALVLANIAPLSFIAKKEVKNWPLIGGISEKFHVQFIERKNKFLVYRDLPIVEETLKQKRSVVVFPEGTTTSGQSASHFYPMFFETAVRSDSLIQPIGLAYTCETGLRLPDIPFIDDDTLIDTLFRMYRHKAIHAHVYFLKPFSPAGKCRKTCATIARKAVNRALDQIHHID